MGLVTVVMDLDTELVPGLTKAQLRAIVKRTLEYTSDLTVPTYVEQQSLDLEAAIEVGIDNRDQRKTAYKQAIANAVG